MLCCRAQDVSHFYMGHYIIVFPWHLGSEARKMSQILHV